MKDEAKIYWLLHSLYFVAAIKILIVFEIHLKSIK